MATYACESITDYVHRESGRILADTLYNRMFATSPLFRLIRRGRFPSEMGIILTNLTFERTAPLGTASNWRALSVVDGSEGGSCLPPVTKIGLGSTLRTFQLYQQALEGPDFCAEDLRYSFSLASQLDNVIDVLTNYVRMEWERHDTLEYFKNVKYKVALTTTGQLITSTTAATYPPTTCADSRLTLEVLDHWRMKLLRDGAAESALGVENGLPIPTIILSAETFDNLKKQNLLRREDLRWGAPNTLLTPFGVPGSLFGYYFLVTPYPRRFTCSGGVYTEVPTFIEEAASKGKKSEINPDWETAELEETLWFDPTVFTQLIPEPVVAPHPRFVFDPVNYTGAWKTMNIQDRHCNPDRTILYHRAIMEAASMPVHPERGVAFVHLRCPPDLNLGACDAT